MEYIYVAGRTPLARMSCRIHPHIHAHALLALIGVLCRIVWSALLQIMTCDHTNWRTMSLVGKTNSSLLKFKMTVIVFTLPNPNMTTKLPDHPPGYRRRE